jgi:hypothetical protein
MLTESEIAVRNAIREVYASRVTGEEIQLDGSVKRLVLQLGAQSVIVNLSKLTKLYESGTSLAAIKTVSRFEVGDFAMPPRDNPPLQRTATVERIPWYRRFFGRGRGH